jgi:hypothetical protein
MVVLRFVTWRFRLAVKPAEVGANFLAREDLYCLYSTKFLDIFLCNVTQDMHKSIIENEFQIKRHPNSYL